MAHLTPERWQRVESLYRAASQRPPDQRAAFLASACEGDQALRREVEWLLAQSGSSTVAPGDLGRRRIGGYELQGLLGVGGMGEVYRAHDTRLGRDVAIKVLPPEVASDADRIARFDREARALATLNHPNIAIIHGVEQAGDARAIVMELVDGETLAERVARVGPLPVAEVLAIARQLADALDAAHEKGIVHRDLKPANIKLTPAGVVKVLDFGLATTARRDTIGPDAPSGMPTVGGGHTSTGTIVGTAAYMSPEQARGHAVDKRTDIWAFGCVLFELLTGRSPFARPTLGDTIAAVLERDPPWDLTAHVPAHVRQLLQRCLEKEPRQRQRDIADARRDLDPPQSPAGDRPRPERSSTLPWAVAGVAVLLAVGGWVFAARERTAVAGTDAMLTRVTWDRGLALEPALSPDGTLVVYASDAAGQGNLDLWVQRVAGGTPVRLTDDMSDDREPVFSPDGASIAFRSERSGGGVYVMPALGGDARLIAAGGRRPQFSPDGTRIAYWTGTPLGGARNAGTAIFTVAANGGSPERRAGGFAYARNPVWAPDGRSLVFFGRQAPPAASGPPVTAAQDFDWWWTSLDRGEPVPTGVYPVLRDARVTFAAASEIEPLPAAWTPDGVLFSATVGQATNLWRVPLSAATGRISGAPVRLTTGSGADGSPTVDRQGRIAFQVSESAESVFVLGLDATAAKSLQTIERLTTDWDLSAHRGSLSQDGRFLAYPRHRPSASELWVKDLTSGDDRHLTTTVQTPQNPTISDDGALVAYTVIADGRRSGHVVPSAGGAVRKVCDDCVMHSWLPDGRRVLVAAFTPRPRAQVLDVETLATRDLFEPTGAIQRIFASRDGRWVAVAGADRAWLVPADADIMATTATAQEITFPRGTLAGRMAGWSPDGRLLYSLLVLDGFRCLYAQRVDPSGRQPAGEPFAVHHFHDPRRAWGSTPNSNAITARGFVFDHLETLSSIWLLDAAGVR